MAPTMKREFYASYEDPPLHTRLLTYFGYYLLFAIGSIREFLYDMGIIKDEQHREKVAEGFTPLFFKSQESFYKRNVFRRMSDCTYRVTTGPPGARLTVLDRVSHDHNFNFQLNGKKIETLNLTSYNYLGFADKNKACRSSVETTVKEQGLGTRGASREMGKMDIHLELNELVAEYLGVEAAMTVGMGYATNSMHISAFVGKECLILSDQFNHASLITGSRRAGARIRVFKHNDMADLERHLVEAITEGQPRTHKPWTKILIIVEGIYSMEGAIVPLPEVIALKKKYKAYLYVDEAHSIGALGPHGKGVVDYFGMDPKDVDIMMGTFTKSFGSAGGYIGGTKKMINHMKRYGQSLIYGNAMSPPVARQIITSMKIMLGKDGTGEGKKRLQQLAWSTRYFRNELSKRGYILYGNIDSPVVPLMLFLPGKLLAFTREALQKGLSTISITYPVCDITKARLRFCVSAGHTKELLDEALRIIDDIGDRLQLRISRKPPIVFPELTAPVA